MGPPEQSLCKVERLVEPCATMMVDVADSHDVLMNQNAAISKNQ